MEIILDEKTQKWLEEYTSKNPYSYIEDRGRAFGLVVEEAVKDFRAKILDRELDHEASLFFDRLESAIGKFANSDKRIFSDSETRDKYTEVRIKQGRFINTIDSLDGMGIECMGMVWLLDKNIPNGELQLRDGKKITKFNLSEFEKR